MWSADRRAFRANECANGTHAKRAHMGSADANAGTLAQAEEPGNGSVTLIIRQSWVRSPPAPLLRSSRFIWHYLHVWLGQFAYLGLSALRWSLVCSLGEAVAWLCRCRGCEGPGCDGDQRCRALPGGGLLSGYGGVAARLVSVLRRRRRVFGGRPAAARWSLRACRAS